MNIFKKFGGFILSLFKKKKKYTSVDVGDLPSGFRDLIEINRIKLEKMPKYTFKSYAQLEAERIKKEEEEQEREYRRNKLKEARGKKQAEKVIQILAQEPSQQRFEALKFEQEFNTLIDENGHQYIDSLRRSIMRSYIRSGIYDMKQVSILFENDKYTWEELKSFLLTEYSDPRELFYQNGHYVEEDVNRPEAVVERFEQVLKDFLDQKFQK